MRNWKKWAKWAIVRSVKTFAQTLIGAVTVGAALSEVQWGYVISVACVAAILSMCTSVAGIPEERLDDGLE